MMLFLSSCDTAIPLLQYFDAAGDCVYAPGDGREGTDAIGSADPTYNEPRATKRITVGGAGDEITMGWWLNIGDAPFGGPFDAFVFAAVHYSAGAAFHVSSTKQLTLICDPDGSLSVMRGNWNGTQVGLATAAGRIGAGTYYVEWRSKISNTDGESEVRFNDEVVLQVEGDTQNLSAPLIDGAEWVPWTIDDLYVIDPTGPRNNSFLGRRFHAIANPMSAVSAAGFTPGTLARLVATDSSLNVAASASLSDLCTPTALDSTIGRILAVQGAMVGLRDSAGPTLADLVDIGEGVSYGTAHALGASSDCYFQIRESQPGGSDPWTRTVYNATTRGYSRRA